jgi:hypothetical protein
MIPGDIISYNEMCLLEGYSLQRGMNFRVGGKGSVILMSVRKGAPYADQVINNGKIIIYEGHDIPKNLSPNPKGVNQSLKTPSGLLTQNGKFFEAANNYKKTGTAVELITVYEKIKDGIWVYNGVFELIDAWSEKSNRRKVFKFKLSVTNKSVNIKKRNVKKRIDLEHNRVIPTAVKLEVFKRDKGKCRECGSNNNLHFDHLLPFSKGGTSLKAENIQLLCARHNILKSNKIV